MDVEVCLKDVTPDVMKKVVKAMMGRLGRKPGQPVDPADEKRSEKERTDAADLHEEKKGQVPKQDVTEDDVPFEVDIEGSGDASESDMDEPPKKQKKKG
jgi:hypothetical protein